MFRFQLSSLPEGGSIQLSSGFWLGRFDGQKKDRSETFTWFKSLRDSDTSVNLPAVHWDIPLQTCVRIAGAGALVFLKESQLQLTGGSIFRRTFQEMGNGFKYVGTVNILQVAFDGNIPTTARDFLTRFDRVISRHLARLWSSVLGWHGSIKQLSNIVCMCPASSSDRGLFIKYVSLCFADVRLRRCLCTPVETASTRFDDTQALQESSQLGWRLCFFFICKKIKKKGGYGCARCLVENW